MVTKYFPERAERIPNVVNQPSLALGSSLRSAVPGRSKAGRQPAGSCTPMVDKAGVALLHLQGGY